MFTAGKNHQGRNAAHTVFARRFRILVYVHFGDGELAFKLLRNFIQRGRDLLTRAAPFSPEINKHSIAAIKHIAIEARVGDGFCSHGNLLNSGTEKIARAGPVSTRQFQVSLKRAKA